MKTIYLVCGGYVCGFIAGISWKLSNRGLTLAITLTAVVGMIGLGVMSALQDNRVLYGMTAVKIMMNGFGRYVIIKASDPTLGWSGSQWVPVNGLGFPCGDWQVSNLDTVEHAILYALRFKFIPVEAN